MYVYPNYTHTHTQVVSAKPSIEYRTWNFGVSWAIHLSLLLGITTVHIVVTGQPTMSYVLSRESFFLFGQSPL